jgi:ELWxxDGT repeat protein
VGEWSAGDDALLFTVPTAGRRGLWSIDGTADGTRPVFDCAPGGEDCPREIQRLARFADGIVFAASDPVHGCGAWVSDGTEAGTRRLVGTDAVPKTCDDLDRPGTRGPRNFAAVGRSLYFVHDDGVHGLEPWISDGTPAGTRLLADVNTGMVPCAGDCNGDGVVRVPELIRGVNVALGGASLRECPAADRGGDERVGVPEVVSAVRSAIEGCGPR